LAKLSLQGNYLHIAVGGYIDRGISAGRLPSCCGEWVHWPIYHCSEFTFILRWVGTLTMVSLQGNYLPVAVGGYIEHCITAGKLPSCCGRWVHWPTYHCRKITFLLRWVGTLAIVSLQGNYLYVAVGGYIGQPITAGKLPSCCVGWVD
jgi:hypothetical protein